MPHDLPDRNSLPWIEPMAHAPAMEMQGPNHWTARDVLNSVALNANSKLTPGANCLRSSST